MSSGSLSALQLDALKEVGNIGAGHAATALSQLLNTTINISEPSVDVVPFKELGDRLGYKDRTIAVLHLFVRGSAPGQMIVIFDRELAHQFVMTFLRRVIGDIEMFDSIYESTLKELANIVAGSYLTAIIKLLGLSLLPSVPTLTYGTTDVALSSLETILPDQEVFLIESKFMDNGTVVAGQFLLIPEKLSLDPMFSVFGLE